MADRPQLPIVYQDSDLVIVNKPAGLFVHRSFLDKNEQYFAMQLVRDQLQQYVFPVHRLDKPTCGLLMFALNKTAAQQLSTQFEHHQIQKTYVALVRGYLNGQGTIDYALKPKLDKIADKFSSKNKAPQPAITEYKTLCQAEIEASVGKYNSVRYSLVKLLPKTGRKHQIRRHLAHLRHPIIGDINYGDNKQNPFFIQQFGFKQLMLMAKTLAFNHPRSNKLVEVNLDFDQNWKRVFNQLGWLNISV